MGERTGEKQENPMNFSVLLNKSKEMSSNMFQIGSKLQFAHTYFMLFY